MLYLMLLKSRAVIAADLTAAAGLSPGILGVLILRTVVI